MSFLQMINFFVTHGIIVFVKDYKRVAGNLQNVSFDIREIEEQPTEWRSCWRLKDVNLIFYLLEQHENFLFAVNIVADRCRTKSFTVRTYSNKFSKHISVADA